MQNQTNGVCSVEWMGERILSLSGFASVAIIFICAILKQKGRPSTTVSPSTMQRSKQM
jgi:hypothetical protein